MFSITIAFGQPATMWTLMWRGKETAEGAFKAIQENLNNKNDYYVCDDFGQQALIQHAVTHGVLLEDMELSKGAHIERALHQARMQAKGAEAAETDPVLRAARFRQGPAVVMPQGLNGPMR